MQVDRIVRDNALHLLDKYNAIYTCNTYQRSLNRTVCEEITRKRACGCGG